MAGCSAHAWPALSPPPTHLHPTPPHPQVPTGGAAGTGASPGAAAMGGAGQEESGLHAPYRRDIRHGGEGLGRGPVPLFTACMPRSRCCRACHPPLPFIRTPNPAHPPLPCTRTPHPQPAEELFPRAKGHTAEGDLEYEEEQYASAEEAPSGGQVGGGAGGGYGLEGFRRGSRCASAKESPAGVLFVVPSQLLSFSD